MVIFQFANCKRLPGRVGFNEIQGVQRIGSMVLFDGFFDGIQWDRAKTTCAIGLMRIGLMGCINRFVNGLKNCRSKDIEWDV